MKGEPMEVQHLIYKGNKTEGSVTIPQEPPLSKFRKLKVFQGMCLEVGKDIPEITAKRVINHFRDIFELRKENLDDLDTFKAQFKDIVRFYNQQFGDDALAVVPALTIEALFSILGDGAMESLLTALRESDEIAMKPEDIKDLVAKVFGIEAGNPAPKEKPAPKKTITRRDKKKNKEGEDIDEDENE
jgi:hypothetical protein